MARRPRAISPKPGVADLQAGYGASTTSLGVKGKVENFVYNTDVFYVDWSDPQLNTSTTNWGFFAVQNGKSATTKGIEAQIDGYTAIGITEWATYTEATLGADLISANGAR